MTLYAVWFRVDYEGDMLEGVFSSLELARAQAARCREVHKATYSSFGWMENSLDSWHHCDLTIEICPVEVDKGKYL